MAYTVNDFITEGMHIQHSNLYYDILKESDELNLMEQFMMTMRRNKYGQGFSKGCMFIGYCSSVNIFT